MAIHLFFRKIAIFFFFITDNEPTVVQIPKNVKKNVLQNKNTYICNRFLKNAEQHILFTK